MNTNKIKEASRELLQAIQQILKMFYRIKAHCWTLQKCVCAPRQRSLIHFTLGLFAWCSHVNAAKFVTPPRNAVLRSRDGVTNSGETRLYKLASANGYIKTVPPSRVSSIRKNEIPATSLLFFPPDRSHRITFQLIKICVSFLDGVIIVLIYEALAVISQWLQKVFRHLNFLQTLYLM